MMGGVMMPANMDSECCNPKSSASKTGILSFYSTLVMNNDGLLRPGRPYQSEEGCGPPLLLHEGDIGLEQKGVVVITNQAIPIDVRIVLPNWKAR